MFVAILLKKSKQHRQKQHFVVVARSFRLLEIMSLIGRKAKKLA
jgi:hypothetical protein